MKNFFKRNKVDKKKFLFTTRDLANHTANGDRISPPHSDSNSQNLSGLTQFYAVGDPLSSSSTMGGMITGIPVASESSGQNPAPKATTEKKDERKTVEPKAVFEELKQQNPEVSFHELDEKIKVVEERINVLKEHLDESHLKDEHLALFYLKNRRKYLETKGKHPIMWASTTRDAVNDLCKRYKLKTVPLKQYYTLVPKQGIDEMNKYTSAYKAITGDTPIYELVIKDLPEKTEEAKQQKKKDRDPILLANSPFSNSIFVLGAWDDEVEVVDEIIYQSK
jgi:hypothetical protein